LRIWDRKILTNGGPFHQQLEQALAEHLGVKHLALLTNGTIALVTALQTLRITGEVITTPYSFVATAHSLLWNGMEPVFADIDPHDAEPRPRAHRGGDHAADHRHHAGALLRLPLRRRAIQRIADTYGLKVIYDAAHAFGVRHQGSSLLNSGDLSVLSFHATKVFNTFEGGAIVCPDAKTKQRIDFLKNFGFADEVTVVAPGINGKLNEVQAAFGLLQLREVDAAIARRTAIATRYREALADVEGIALMPEPADTTPNHSYMPIRVQPGYGLSRDGLYQRLREQQIFSRRYFYPLISDMPMYRGLPSAQPTNLPVARRVASEILCLPIYPALSDSDQQRVIDVVRSGANR
jgi:dTDP-4-amino-4,6-dideoxygalactose transaminase